MREDGRIARRAALGAALVALAACASSAAEEGVEIFVVIYAPGPSWVEGRPMREQDLRDHGVYIGRLRDEGRLFAGGGWVDADGGMALFLAGDRAAAEAMLAADPAVLSGVFVATLQHWRPRFRTQGPLP